MTKLLRLLPMITLVLTACSITPQKGQSKSHNSIRWHQHQQEVNHFRQYQARGAFAYISSQTIKNYARFFWQQIGQDNYRLLLLNPLGKTELELHAEPGKAQIIDKKGQHYTAVNAEEIIRNLTGIPIPLNSLHLWILGLPGAATNYRLDKQYRLRELHYSQNGATWKVIYAGYSTTTTPALPSSMELTQNGQRIKIKMDNWIVK